MSTPRTLVEMAAVVNQRLAGASAATNLGEIYRALYNANNTVHARYAWPWTYVETKIDIEGVYTTGTVSGTNGSNVINGTGTSWDTIWKDRRILIGTYAYIVSSITGATQLTLNASLNVATNPTNVGYTMFRDTYPLPADYSPGNDITVINPVLRMPIKKIPRMTLDDQSALLKNMFTSIQFSYCDYGFDSTTKRYKIQFVPPPAAKNEFRMTYRRRPPALTLPEDVSMLPDEYAIILEHLAVASIKKDNRIPGWVEAEQDAAQMLDAMRRRLSRAPVVNMVSDHGSPVGNSSITSLVPGGYVGINPS